MAGSGQEDGGDEHYGRTSISVFAVFFAVSSTFSAIL